MTWEQAISLALLHLLHVRRLQRHEISDVVYELVNRLQYGGTYYVADQQTAINRLQHECDYLTNIGVPM